MELSICANYVMQNSDFIPVRKLSDVAGQLKNAGFDYVDYSPDFLSEDWREKAYRDREVLDKTAITVEQTHAPFNRYCRYEDELFPVYCKRLFEASKIVGAKYVVVHADEYRVRGKYDEKEILDYTCKYLEPYVEYASKNGLVIAIENVFEDHSTRWPMVDGKSRFTSRIEELLAVIEYFNNSSVACCWDFGHAKCSFGKEKMADALRQVGRHVVCTHVHDNYYDKDLHVIPFEGDTNWEENMKALKDIEYKGKFSFEFAYGGIPDVLLPFWLKYIHETGTYLTDMYDTMVCSSKKMMT